MNFQPLIPDKPNVCYPRTLEVALSELAVNRRFFDANDMRQEGWVFAINGQLMTPNASAKYQKYMFFASGEVKPMVQMSKWDEAKRRLASKLQYNFHEVPELIELWNGTSLFWTLTYDPEHYPEVDKPYDFGADFRQFMNTLKNTLKKNLEGMQYFACLEQGTKHKRWHFHFCCNRAFIGFEDVERLWGRGNVHYDRLKSIKSVIGYICKYVSKTVESNEYQEPRGYNAELTTCMHEAHPVIPRHPIAIGRSIFTSRGFIPRPKRDDCFPIQFIDQKLIPRKEGYGERNMVSEGAPMGATAFSESEIGKNQDFINLMKSAFSAKMRSLYEEARMYVRRIKELTHDDDEYLGEQLSNQQLAHSRITRLCRLVYKKVLREEFHYSKDQLDLVSSIVSHLNENWGVPVSFQRVPNREIPTEKYPTWSPEPPILTELNEFLSVKGFVEVPCPSPDEKAIDAYLRENYLKY